MLHRDQFEIPQNTETYAEVLQILDKEFVGTSSRLASLVHVLCGEMGAAFEDGGLPCPPWRQCKAMLSKWLPSKVQILPSSLVTRLHALPLSD